MGGSKIGLKPLRPAALARDWVQLSVIAERYGRKRSVERGYAALLESILAGRFEQRGNCRLLFLSPRSGRIQMTVQRMRETIEAYNGHSWDATDTIHHCYVGNCFILRGAAIQWCLDHDLNPVGWLTGRLAKQRSKPGRKPENDGPLVEEVRRLIAGGERPYGAAEAVARTVNPRQAKSIARRLVRKI